MLDSNDERRHHRVLQTFHQTLPAVLVHPFQREAVHGLAPKAWRVENTLEIHNRELGS